MADLRASTEFDQMVTAALLMAKEQTDDDALGWMAGRGAAHSRVPIYTARCASPEQAAAANKCEGPWQQRGAITAQSRHGPVLIPAAPYGHGYYCVRPLNPAAYVPTPDCPAPQFLGLWTDQEPYFGYEHQPHGTIWLFEQGIRGLGPDLFSSVYEVTTHELGHALQRDHVLDAMEASAGGRASAAPCNCPGRRAS